VSGYLKEVTDEDLKLIHTTPRYSRLAQNRVSYVRTSRTANCGHQKGDST